MEVGVRQNLRDDIVSSCHSFGSNYHPSSQSRKISIGITVDSSSKRKPASAKENEVKIPNSERINLNKEIPAEAKSKGDVARAVAKGKQTEATEQVNSPWITTRSSNQNAPVSDTALHTKQASRRPNTGWRRQKLNGLKDAQITHSVQFFANQTSALQSRDSSQKKFNGMTYKRNRGKNGRQEQVEEFTLATAHEAITSGEVVEADKTDRTENRTETLRMKLWQILGTVSSPKSQHSNSQAHDIGAEKLQPEQFVDRIGNTVIRPKQGSDTIETDSESPKKPISRSLTRSLTRKRASSKLQENITKTGPSSSTKQNHQMRIFSFEEGRTGKLSGSVNFVSKLSTQKKSQRKSYCIEPCKISFSEKEIADEPQRASNNTATLTKTEKKSSVGHKLGSFHGCQPQDKRDYFESNSKTHERDFCHLSESKKMNKRVDSQGSVENGDNQEDHRLSSKNVVEPADEFQSPTFAFKTPILNPSPCSTPRTVQVVQDVPSPPLEDRRFNVGSIHSFRTLQTSKPDAETESPCDAEKLQDSSPGRPSSSKERKNAEDDLAEFSSEDGYPGGSEDGSPLIKGHDWHRETSPETRPAEKPYSMNCPTKRLRNHGGIGVDELSPPMPSPTGIGESFWIHEPSEQKQEDELARAITMFSFALENFRRKMDSATKKKSSEILMSVSEGIHLQLQNVESQIQTDIGKLTSLSKSKRKRLETRFEEQQEQLKLIHKKFKEDIHHHLQDCRRTLEVLEAHQTELKGTVKRQKTSHQKLILQLEQAVEVQLTDAQRKIITVHELAREKMLQLKRVIAECLKEDIPN